MYGIAHLVAGGGIAPVGQGEFSHGEFSLQGYQEPTRPFEEYLVAAQPPEREVRDALPVVQENFSREQRASDSSRAAADERDRREAIRRTDEQRKVRDEASADRVAGSRTGSPEEPKKKEATETRLSKRKTDDLKKPIPTGENDQQERGYAAGIDTAALVLNRKAAIGSEEPGAAERGAAAAESRDGSGKNESIGKSGDADHGDKAGQAENREAAAPPLDEEKAQGDLSRKPGEETRSERVSRADARREVLRDDGESRGGTTAAENDAREKNTSEVKEVKEVKTDERSRSLRGEDATSENVRFVQARGDAVSRADGGQGLAGEETAREAVGRLNEQKRGASASSDMRREGEAESEGEALRTGRGGRGRLVTGAPQGEQGDARDNGSDEGSRNVREITVNLLDEADSASEENTMPGFRDLMARLEGTQSGGEQRVATNPTANAAHQLARRLNGELGDSIVRQAQVIMKDSDAGEIRLIIRPPELGRVRIQLQMDQGHIAGRILVDNQNVRQAIEQNLASLQRAFAEAGLEMGELEVGTGDARNQSGHNPGGSGDTDRSRGSERRAEQFGRSVKVQPVYDYGNRHVNLVA